MGKAVQKVNRLMCSNIHKLCLVIGKLVIINCLLFIECDSPANPDKIRKQNEAIQYARIYSGTESIRNWNDEYWDNVAQFMYVDGFNRVMDLSRTPQMKYSDSADFWNWVNDEKRMHFDSLRNELK
ncbi:MAG: hypothetical protein GX556_09705 [Fibrobacter sp.]|nr:hypothetical protein [Fibrobacter sp.]